MLVGDTLLLRPSCCHASALSHSFQRFHFTRLSFPFLFSVAKSASFLICLIPIFLSLSSSFLLPDSTPTNASFSFSSSPSLSLSFLSSLFTNLRHARPAFHYSAYHFIHLDPRSFPIVIREGGEGGPGDGVRVLSIFLSRRSMHNITLSFPFPWSLLRMWSQYSF